MLRIIYFILLVSAFSCREKYIPEQVAPADGYLVVEGNINGGDNPTTIVLSRTGTLTSGDRIFENNATVVVEGKDNSQVRLLPTFAGNYTIDHLALDKNQTYRLHITTAGGKEYVSDYVAVKQTPPVDSISWVREDGGVRIYVNTHDDAALTKYYQWEYDETWEFHSPYLSILDYNLSDPDNPFLKYIDSSTFSYIRERYTCWKNRSSDKLLLGSSAKLTQDKIYLPLTFIPNNAKELSVLYSMNLKQYALSRDAYEYLDKMKKNTEGTGTIFDPQPSALKGNIHALNDPAEMVIGYVNVSSVREKRLFIYAAEVPKWYYRSTCESKEIQNNRDSIVKAINEGWVPADPAKMISSAILSFYGTRAKACIDCTQEGYNKKPAFWP